MMSCQYGRFIDNQGNIHASSVSFSAKLKFSGPNFVRNSYVSLVVLQSEAAKCRLLALFRKRTAVVLQLNCKVIVAALLTGSAAA